MSREHIDHKDLVRFAEDKVNLPKAKADAHREQVNGLRSRLENYLDEHPDFSLKKMQLSGSLAKGTALRSLNDIDVAVYVAGVDAPEDVKALIDYIAEKLKTAYPNFKPEQIKPQTYSITVSFVGSGLDVDVVPVIYRGKPEWRGDLVSQDDGSLLETSIPLHLEFVRKRKRQHEKDFAQVIRLIKAWAKLMKQQREGFRFKSFMIELILAKLSDSGTTFTDYPEAMQAFFTYVARTGLRERIVFEDHYAASAVGKLDDVVQIIDPINSANNVARLYTREQAAAIASAALDAGDAIDAALKATTKARTVEYWQVVFGSQFQG